MISGTKQHPSVPAFPGCNLLLPRDIHCCSKLQVVMSGCDANLQCSSCSCRFMKLALQLLHEQELGQASRLAPYLTYLPKTFSTPFTWSDQQLQQLRYPFVTHEVSLSWPELLLISIHLFDATSAIIWQLVRKDGAWSYDLSQCQEQSGGSQALSNKRFSIVGHSIAVCCRLHRLPDNVPDLSCGKVSKKLFPKNSCFLQPAGKSLCFILKPPEAIRPPLKSKASLFAMVHLSRDMFQGFFLLQIPATSPDLSRNLRNHDVALQGSQPRPYQLG